MITLKTFEHTPNLAELKVSYRRSRRRNQKQNQPPWILTSPVKCDEYLRTLWDKDTLDLREEFVVLCLSSQLEVLGWVKLHTGGIDQAPVDPRLVFGVALQTASAGFIVAHNHPGQNATPSEQDKAMTKRLRDGANLLGLRFVDHIIVTRESCYSFSESAF